MKASSDLRLPSVCFHKFPLLENNILGRHQILPKTQLYFDFVYVCIRFSHDLCSVGHRMIGMEGRWRRFMRWRQNCILVTCGLVWSQLARGAVWQPQGRDLGCWCPCLSFDVCLSPNVVGLLETFSGTGCTCKEEYKAHAQVDSHSRGLVPVRRVCGSILILFLFGCVCYLLDSLTTAGHTLVQCKRRRSNRKLKAAAVVKGNSLW